MAYESNERATADTDTRRKVFIIMGVGAALVLAALLYFVTRPAASGTTERRLEGALRPGDSAFEQALQQVVLDSKEADQSPRPLGDIVMTLRATARNFTGQTITGLEVRGAVVDSVGNPIKERTVIVLPSGQTTLDELQPNKTMPVRVVLEGFKQSDDRADYRIEITGVRFK